MQITEDNIAVGDWVQLIDHRFSGYIGFILNYDPFNNQYRVMITKNSKGISARGKAWLETDQMVLLNRTKDEDDLLHMIDLALEMNDKEWFMELSAQLP